MPHDVTLFLHLQSDAIDAADTETDLMRALLSDIMPSPSGKQPPPMDLLFADRLFAIMTLYIHAGRRNCVFTLDNVPHLWRWTDPELPANQVASGATPRELLMGFLAAGCSERERFNAFIADQVGT